MNRLKPTRFIQQEVVIHREGCLDWAVLKEFLHNGFLIRWDTVRRLS